MVKQSEGRFIEQFDLSSSSEVNVNKNLSPGWPLDLPMAHTSLFNATHCQEKPRGAVTGEKAILQ